MRNSLIRVALFVYAPVLSFSLTMTFLSGVADTTWTVTTAHRRIALGVVLMVVTCFACKAAYLPEGTCNVGVFQCFKSERHLQGGSVPMSQI